MKQSILKREKAERLHALLAVPYRKQRASPVIFR